MNRLKVMALLLVMLSCVTLSACSQEEPLPSAKPNHLVIVDDSMDLQGREIRYFYQGVRSSSTGDLGGIYWDTRNTQEQRMVDNIRRMEKEFNCRIVLANITRGDLMQAAMTQTAAADIGEFKEADVLQSISLRNRGYLAQLNPYEEYLNFEDGEAWDIGLMKHFRFGTNTTHVLCRNTFNERGANILGLRFNKTMMKDAGLWENYNLYDLQEGGLWTWDVFEEICGIIGKDTDSDGRQDVFGINYSQTLLDAFSVSNMYELSSVLIDVDPQHNVTFKANQPEFRQAFDLMARMVNNSSMYCDINSEREAYTDFKDGRYLFNLTAGKYLHAADTYGFEYGLVTIPIGPNNRFRENYGFMQPVDTVDQLAMIKYAKQPIALVRILKELATPPLSYAEMKSAEQIILTQEYHYDEDMLVTNDMMNVDGMTSYDMKKGIFHTDTDEYYRKIERALVGQYSVDQLFGADVETAQQEVAAKWEVYKIGLEELG